MGCGMVVYPIFVPGGPEQGDFCGRVCTIKAGVIRV